MAQEVDANGNPVTPATTWSNAPASAASRSSQYLPGSGAVVSLCPSAGGTGCSYTSAPRTAGQRARRGQQSVPAADQCTHPADLHVQHLRPPRRDSAPSRPPPKSRAASPAPGPPRRTCRPTSSRASASTHGGRKGAGTNGTVDEQTIVYRYAESSGASTYPYQYTGHKGTDMATSQKHSLRPAGSAPSATERHRHRPRTDRHHRRRGLLGAGLTGRRCDCPHRRQVDSPLPGQGRRDLRPPGPRGRPERLPDRRQRQPQPGPVQHQHQRLGTCTGIDYGQWNIVNGSNSSGSDLEYYSFGNPQPTFDPNTHALTSLSVQVVGAAYAPVPRTTTCSTRRTSTSPRATGSSRTCGGPTTSPTAGMATTRPAITTGSSTTTSEPGAHCGPVTSVPTTTCSARCTPTTRSS